MDDEFLDDEYGDEPEPDLDDYLASAPIQPPAPSLRPPPVAAAVLAEAPAARPPSPGAVAAPPSSAGTEEAVQPAAPSEAKNKSTKKKFIPPPAVTFEPPTRAPPTPPSPPPQQDQHPPATFGSKAASPAPAVSWSLPPAQADSAVAMLIGEGASAGRSIELVGDELAVGREQLGGGHAVSVRQLNLRLSEQALEQETLVVTRVGAAPSGYMRSGERVLHALPMNQPTELRDGDRVYVLTDQAGAPTADSPAFAFRAVGEATEPARRGAGPASRSEAAEDAAARTSAPPALGLLVARVRADLGSASAGSRRVVQPALDLLDLLEPSADPADAADARVSLQACALAALSLCEADHRGLLPPPSPAPGSAGPYQETRANCDAMLRAKAEGGDGETHALLALVGGLTALCGRACMAELCLRLLATACADGPRASLAAECGALPAAVAALERHTSSDPGVVEAALRLLCALCSSTHAPHEEAKELAVSHGALSAVALGMREHPSLGHLQCCGCWAIFHLTTGLGLGRRVRGHEEEIGAALTAALREHAARRDVAEAGCRALRALCHGTDTGAERRIGRAAKTGAVEAVIGAMVAGAEVPSVQEHGSLALRSLCDGPLTHARRQQAVDGGALEAVVGGLRLNSTRPAVVIAASWALATLCAGDDDTSRARKALAVERGATAALQGCAKAHPTHRGVIDQVRWATAKIAHRRRTPRPYTAPAAGRLSTFYRAGRAAGHTSAASFAAHLQQAATAAYDPAAVELPVASRKVPIRNFGGGGGPKPSYSRQLKRGASRTHTWCP